ncbi:unnamed protein product, partial [Closterium sp. Naga37s-1]
SQGVVLATDADREGEAIAWHVYQLLKGAAAARRRAEVQQREKEQRRERMVQQAVLIEQQLAAEAQEAAEEGGGAALQGAEGWEEESDIFSSGAAAAESSLPSPEAEGSEGLGGPPIDAGGGGGPAAGSNGCDLTIHRATFHEITPSAVLSALSHPRLLSQPLVDAYFARRVLDFLMGFNLSPVLWRKLPGCKSAGRVQSVALRFVCEREGEVAGFNAQEYWTVSAMVQACRTTKGAVLGSSKGLPERKLAGRGRDGGGEGGGRGEGAGAGEGSDAPLSFPARLTHLFGEPVGAGAGAGGGGAGAGARRAKEGKEAKEVKEAKQGKEGEGKEAEAAEVEGGIRDGERALAAAMLVEGSELQVQGVHRSQTRRSPSPPFTTSSMQQEASSKLGFSPSRTMSVAQRLYEGVALGPEASRVLQGKGAGATKGAGRKGSGGGGVVTGLITYMRTDSVQVSQTAVASLRSLLQQKYGSKLVSPSPRVFASKARNAQEAHEAIRPTHPHLLPALVKPDLSEEQWKLYALVWARFAASQMANAVYDRVAVDIAAYPLDPSLLSAFPSQIPSDSGASALDPAAPSASPPALLRANAFAIAWPGFLAAYSDSRTLGYLSDLSEGITTEPPPGDAMSAEADSTAATSDVFQEIMALQPGDRLLVESVDPSQHFTRPPPRYTEAALIKKMEAEGIGRPSTYAPTLKTLLERKYVELDSRRLHPTIRGRLANAFLLHFMEPYVNAGFTAQLESKFDDVAAGEEDWRQVLRSFWTDFQPRVEEMHKLSPQAVGSAVQVTLGDGLLVEAAETYSEVLAKARAPPLSPSSSSSASSASLVSPSSEPSALAETHVSSPSSPASSLSTASHSKTCPSCGSGELEYNFSSRGVGLFVGCSAYPTCHFKARVVEQEGKAGTLAVAIDPVAHIIGEDPSTGAKIWLKVGPYGAYVERSSYGKVSKVNRASLPPGTHPDSVDLPKALELLAFPRTIGPHPEGGTVLLCNGPFGFYVEHDYPGIGLIRASLGTNVSIDDVTLESAIERLQVKQARAERAAAKKAAKAAKTGKGSKAGSAETSTEAGKGGEKEATKEARKRASKEAGKKASKNAGKDKKGELLQQEEVKGDGMGAGGAGTGGKAVSVKKGKEAEEREGRGGTAQEFTREEQQERRGSKGGAEVARRNRLPRRPSEQLKEIIGKEHEQLSIFEAARLVWDYVKANNLKTGKNTAAFDERLRELFGVDEAHSTKVPGLLLPHMQEVAEAGKEASEVGREASLVRKEASEVEKEVAQAEEGSGKEGESAREGGKERGQETSKLKGPRKQESKAVGRSKVTTDVEAGEEAGKEGKAARERGEEDQERGDTEEGERGKGETAQEVKLRPEQQRMKVLASLGGAEIARRNRLPRRPSEQLKEIIGKEHEQLSIFEATRLVWDYVKAHNLKTGSRTAAFDDKLRALFGVDSAHSTKVPGLLLPHMKEVESSDGALIAESSDGAPFGVDGAHSTKVPGLLLPHMQEVAEAGRKVSQVVKEASEVGREAAHVGKKASKVGKEASEAGKEAAQVVKEASQVGKEASQVEKEASKLGKEAAKVGKQSNYVRASKGGSELIRLKQLPRRPSEQLKEIIGKEHEQLSILEATTLVWNYIKANNLQAGPNSAAFDDKLRTLFGV